MSNTKFGTLLSLLLINVALTGWLIKRAGDVKARPLYFVEGYFVYKMDAPGDLVRYDTIVYDNPKPFWSEAQARELIKSETANFYNEDWEAQTPFEVNLWITDYLSETTVEQ